MALVMPAQRRADVRKAARLVRLPYKPTTVRLAELEWTGALPLFCGRVLFIERTARGYVLVHTLARAPIIVAAWLLLFYSGAAVKALLSWQIMTLPQSWFHFSTNCSSSASKSISSAHYHTPKSGIRCHYPFLEAT